MELQGHWTLGRWDLMPMQLMERGSVEELKEFFDSDIWHSQVAQAAHDLPLRKQMYESLSYLRSKLNEAVETLWSDWTISFARNLRSKEVTAFYEKAKDKLTSSNLSYQLLGCGLIILAYVVLIIASNVDTNFHVDGVIALSCVIMTAIGGFLIALLPEIRIRREAKELHMADEQKRVEAMALVEKTEQYQTIQELKGLVALVEAERERVSWPPI